MRFISSDGERDSRFHRLLDVLEFVHNLYSGLDPFRSVEALLDHKGELTVHWRDRPTEEQKTLFHVAWATAGMEPYDNVYHEWKETDGHMDGHGCQGGSQDDGSPRLPLGDCS
jgi:hypothetical protein